MQRTDITINKNIPSLADRFYCRVQRVNSQFIWSEHQYQLRSQTRFLSFLKIHCKKNNKHFVWIHSARFYNNEQHACCSNINSSSIMSLMRRIRILTLDMPVSLHLAHQLFFTLSPFSQPVTHPYNLMKQRQHEILDDKNNSAGESPCDSVS